MKRLIITLALGVFLLGVQNSNAQTSINANINIGTPGAGDGFYYGGIYDYPEDYYSEYPDDYYPTAYYQDNYRDYNRSIIDVNWNNLFVELRLSNAQINAILVLNKRFPSYRAWNNFYGVNPSRWYYDRFYSLRRILTPTQYTFFYNRYYGGVMPVRYFVNHHHSYYAPRFRPMPRYRSVNRMNYRRPAWRMDTHKNYGRLGNNGHRYNFKKNDSHQYNNSNRNNWNQQKNWRSPQNSGHRSDRNNWNSNKSNPSNNRGNWNKNQKTSRDWNRNKNQKPSQNWNKDRGNVNKRERGNWTKRSPENRVRNNHFQRNSTNFVRKDR